MADIRILSRLLGGISRDVDLQSNSLVVGSLKVGTSSPTELTKTVLDRLINLQNGSDVDSGYHTHDARYFTQAQIGSTSGTSGAQRTGVKSTAVNFVPSAANVEAWLTGIDSALATVGVTDFSDSVFRVSDNGDSTKKMAFEVSAIATGTVRTISMPNANVNLANVNQALLQDGTRPLLANLDANGNKLTNLASGSAAGDAVNFSQLQNALSGLDFQPDVNNFVANATTTAPGVGLPAAATGQRYILASGTGSLNVAWGTITGVGNNDIVQYNGTSWVVAYDVSVQGDGALVWNKSALYFMRYDGTVWAEFGGLAGITAGNGLIKTGNTLDLNFAELSAVAIATGDELVFGDVSDTDIVKKITVAGLNSFLNHNALSNYVANEHINHSAVSITTAAGSGLAGGGDITTTRSLSVDITGQTAKATPVAIDEVMIWSVADTARRKVTVEDLAKNQNVYRNFVAGQSFAANTTFSVRLAVNGESAGRVYATEIDANVNNNFYSLGLLLSTTAITAGDVVKVLISGEHTLGSSDAAFDSTEIGQPVHIKAAGAWDAISQITYTAGQASFRFGYVQTTTKIFLDGSKQLNGIA